MSGFRVGMTTRLWSPASTSACGRTGSGNGSSEGIRNNRTAMSATAAIDAAIALHIIRGALTDRRTDTLCSFASAWRARSISSAASTSGLDTATRSASLAAAILCASAAHRRQSRMCRLSSVSAIPDNSSGAATTSRSAHTAHAVKASPPRRPARLPGFAAAGSRAP